MFDSATYQRRRQALRNKVQNGIILILGHWKGNKKIMSKLQ